MSVLTRKGVSRTLFSMAFPMLAGTFAMNAYNFTDTWFVSKLGTRPLAAMGFIFPVVMLLSCVARGIGSGLTTLVSHAIGRQDHNDAARLVTHGILLNFAVTAFISVAGMALMRPLFGALGADEQMIPLVSAYMAIWYIGALTMTLPMVGNGILISAGDSKAASWTMIIGTIINIILNPIMIFGYFGFPKMGICGSALATVVAQTISMVWMVDLLWRKHRLIRWNMHGLTDSVRRIVTFSVPSVMSMILMPISATVITKLLSAHGHEAVAASGAAQRIESFAFMVPMALGISLTPFVSQNFGAGCMDRVRKAQKVTTAFALSYGGFITTVFFLSANWLASIFTKDPKVAGILVLYIHIISFGYGMMEVHRYCGFFLTGLHKPGSATVLNSIRILVLLIPCSYLGAHFWGITGIFGGRLVTDLVVGCIGIAWVSKTLSYYKPNSLSPLTKMEQ